MVFRTTVSDSIHKDLAGLQQELFKSISTLQQFPLGVPGSCAPVAVWIFCFHEWCSALSLHQQTFRIQNDICMFYRYSFYLISVHCVICFEVFIDLQKSSWALCSFPTDAFIPFKQFHTFTLAAANWKCQNPFFLMETLILQPLTYLYFTSHYCL